MHEHLLAPWRLTYLQNPPAPPSPLPESLWLPAADRGCFLCRAAVDPDRRSTLTPIRTDTAMVVLNRYPYNNGHLLLAPRRHVGELRDLTAEEQLELHQLLVRMTDVLRDRLHCDGVNIGLNVGRAAGAGLPGHLHWHLVPRWQGDTNFLPITAEVRVISQALESLYDLLYEA